MVWYRVLRYGTVWWHDRPRVSVWWSSEWGEAGESAAPELCRRCLLPPRDAQSTPVQAHNQTLSASNDIDINIGRRENIVVNNIKEWTSQCNLVAGLSKSFIIDTGMNNII